MMRSCLTSSLLAAGVGVAAFRYPDCTQPPLVGSLACDVRAPPADRAAALVKMMDIADKVVNLVNTSPGAARIGLPPYQWWSEALHGVGYSPGVNFTARGAAYGSATSFAAPIVLSASFDDELVHDVATVISTEARAFANGGHAGLDFWTPNINAWRDPRWGRGSETPGEDPMRIKGYVKALLAGLEGDHAAATRKVVATCKHFAAYDLEAWGGVTRFDFDAVVTLQDLSEYYLPPFQQCARDSRVGSIMCSYNAVNGTPACANTYLMNDILRQHWNWTADDNYITSDCGAIDNFSPRYHNYSQTAPEAAAAAYLAGTDSVCETYVPAQVAAAYNQSLLPEATVDRALRRLYHGLIKAGYLDPASRDPYRSLTWADVNTASAQALAVRSAAEGLILLKNKGNTLPLRDLAAKRVAMIGFWANATIAMLGLYPGAAPYWHNPLYAAQQRGLNYRYASGPIAQNTSVADTWTEPALAAAAQADVVLYFGGTDASIAAEALDRTSIAWPAAQLALVQALAGLGKPLVVVQLGDQVDDAPLLHNPNVSAIVFAGYPGQSGGTAVLDVLTGTTAPAGRLPVTQYPARYVDQVPMTDMTLRPAAAGGLSGGGSPGRTYRWYDSKDDAMLPFGFGLHYTRFAVSFDTPTLATRSTASLVSGCTAAHLDLCPFLSVPVAVSNTVNGTTSDFVALLFVGGAFGPPPYPRKTLVAYARAHDVAPGQTTTLVLNLTLAAVARVDAHGNTVVYPGTYRLMLDVPTVAEVEFVLTGEELELDRFPQPQETTKAKNNHQKKSVVVV